MPLLQFIILEILLDMFTEDLKHLVRLFLFIIDY